VAVGLCQIKPELADVIKAEYYRICPLTVPRQAEGGLVGDDMFDNMGFLKLRDTGGWEDSQQWLVRMNKVLCAFSVTLIQPEGAPFGLSDGWAWLSNMINACSRCVQWVMLKYIMSYHRKLYCVKIASLRS
jgi:GLE1-like protein